MKTFSKFFIYSSLAIPWGFAIMLSLFYLHAYLITGTLPSYAKPDPKDLSIYPVYALIVYPLMILWLFTVLPYIVSIISFTVRFPSKKYFFPIALFIIGQTLCFYIITQTEMFDWFLD